MEKKRRFFASLQKNLQYMKSLPAGERLPFLWDYYRTAMIAVPASILIVALIIGTVGNVLAGFTDQRESLSVAVAADNLQNIEDVAESLFQAVSEEYGVPCTLLHTSGYYTGNTEFEVEFVCWLSAGQPDLFICDKASLDYCRGQEILGDLTMLLPELQLGGPVFWVDISDSSFVQKCATNGEPVYLCCVENAAGPRTAVSALLQKLLE